MFFEERCPVIGRTYSGFGGEVFGGKTTVFAPDFYGVFSGKKAVGDSGVIEFVLW